MTLQLEYAFSPSPFPILASESDSIPSYIDLQMMVTNGNRLDFTFEKITIDIMAGNPDSANSLCDGSLPDPEYDNSQGWTITTDTGSVTIIPSTGQTGTLGKTSIVFTLSQIKVSQIAGTVPISITETISDDQSDQSLPNQYSLTKEPTNYPVSNFHADPPSLDTLDQCVTIYWTGSEEVYFKLVTSTDPLEDCVDVDTGIEYQAYDGENGVVSPKLNTTTYFTLIILQTSSDGDDDATVLGCQTITVNMNAVALPDANCYVTPLAVYPGQSVLLHWTAQNATYVTVQVGGGLIDDNAPLDTYNDGYPVLIPGTANSGTLAITVTAYNPLSPKPAQQPFNVTVNAIAQVTMPEVQQPNGFAFVRQLANTSKVVASMFDSSVRELYLYVFDTAAPDAPQPKPFQTGQPLATVGNVPGISADGTYAMLSLLSSYQDSDGVLFIVNLASASLEVAISVQVNTFATNPVNRPDPSDPTEQLNTLVWGAFQDPTTGMAKIVLNQAGWSICPNNCPSIVFPSDLGSSSDICGMAFTTDGNYLLVTHGANLLVFDVNNPTAQPQVVPVLTNPTSMNTLCKIEVSPDNHWAVIVDEINAAYVVDITTAPYTVNPTPIATSFPVTDIVFMPDSSRVFLVVSGVNKPFYLVYSLIEQQVLNTVTPLATSDIGYIALNVIGDLVVLWGAAQESRPSFYLYGAAASPSNLGAGS
jgi:hypothetical protein